jgi:hypothetical protein
MKIIIYISNTFSFAGIFLTYKLIKLELLDENDMLIKFKSFYIFKKVSLQEKIEAYKNIYSEYLKSKNIMEPDITIPNELSLLQDIKLNI